MTETQTPTPSPSPSPANADASAVRRPSRGLYGLALVILLIGTAAFVASVNVARAKVAAFEASLQKMVAPGKATFHLAQPGSYCVYYEKIGEFNGRQFDTTGILPHRPNEMPRLNLGLTSDATGDNIALARARETHTQMYGHGRANSEFTFEITQPGDYTLTAEHANAMTDELLLTVGPPVMAGATTDWFGPFGGASVLAFAIIGSAILALVTWTLRHGYYTRRVD